MVQRVEQKIEQRLVAMTDRCKKQNREPMKVEREIGRLLGQNTRAAKLFDVTVKKTKTGHAAHIFVCFLAYVLWKTLGQMCQKAGLGNEPRRVLEELDDHGNIARACGTLWARPSWFDSSDSHVPHGNQHESIANS